MQRHAPAIGLPGSACAWITLRRARVLAMRLALALAAGSSPVRAAEAEIVSLGQPCRAKQVLGGCVVQDRATGRELFALANMNEVTGGELILINVRSGRAERHRAPAGAGSWNVREVSSDRLVIGTFYDGTFLIFDLRHKRFVHHVRFAKEEYLWNTALGADGRIYAGTYPGGRLGALDLATYRVEDCGAPAAPNLYLNVVSATHDARLLCSFSTAQPVQKLYDIASRQWSDVPETLRGVTQGVAFRGHFVAGGRVFRDRDFNVVPPPFPVPGDGWQVEAPLSSDHRLILRRGHAVFSYVPENAGLTKLCELDLRGGRFLAVTERGDLLGVRGQDWFRIRRGETKLELKPIPTESGPRNLLFLRTDPRGRLWTGPPFGQTLCYLDPATGRSTNTRTICDAGGEVFDVAFRGREVFAVTYSGGDIVRYDPNAPWDQWNDRNPKTIASVGPLGYVRPVGGALIGPAGLLYSGWMAKYGTYGGAIATTDPASGKTELIENPLGEQTVAGLATDGRVLFAGTDRTANGLPIKPNDSARFGVIEPGSKRTLATHTLTNATRVSAVSFDRRSGRVVCAVDGRLHGFDPERAAAPPLEIAAPRVSTRTIAAPGNGMIYYGSGKRVVSWDLEQGRATTLATLPANPENITLDAQGHVFLSAGPDLYRLKQPLIP